MTETEIESIAKMASISDEILRIIANTRGWMKRYGIVRRAGAQSEDAGGDLDEPAERG